MHLVACGVRKEQLTALDASNTNLDTETTINDEIALRWHISPTHSHQGLSIYSNVRLLACGVKKEQLTAFDASKTSLDTETTINDDIALRRHVSPTHNHQGLSIY